MSDTGFDGFQSAEDCEAAFYEAFRRGDPGAMAAAWSNSSHVLCIHPAAPPLTGFEAVMASWRNILRASTGSELRFQCLSRVASGGLAIHTGIEFLGVDGGETVLVSATNVYERTAEGWKMRMHHAAPIRQQAASSRQPVH